jgi:hypothetical protein
MGCYKTRQISLSGGVTPALVPTLLVIIVLLWPSTVSEGTALSAEAIVRNKPVSMNRGRSVPADPFEAMLARHNLFKPEFALWRERVAQHADTLAQLVKRFPNGTHLNAERLRRVFANPRDSIRRIAGQDVFAPWTNRWSGTWSNGVQQYHVWWVAYFSDGQWIQPVSLSEYGFTGFHRVEENLQSGLVDIAINVFSYETGITGWVSKWQDKRVEMPHIGYRIDATTLVWFCQIKSPEQLFTVDNRWFVFLETVDRRTNPQEYRIYGVPLTFEETITVTTEQMGKHYGTYYSFTNPVLLTTQVKEMNHGH